MVCYEYFVYKCYNKWFVRIFLIVERAYEGCRGDKKRPIRKLIGLIGIALLFYAEFICCVAVVFFPGFEIGGWPIFLIGRVGIFLGFQAYGGLARIGNSFFAFNARSEEVACVNLYAWFVGEYFHKYS